MNPKNEKLIKAREKRGLTQVQVAEKSRISVGAYQRYEYGDRKPGVDIAIRIAKILNSTVEELFGAGTPNNSNQSL